MQSLEDVTGAEFRMFMDFLKSLGIFGEKAPPERMKELIGIIEGQADLDAQFDVSYLPTLLRQDMAMKQINLHRVLPLES